MTSPRHPCAAWLPCLAVFLCLLAAPSLPAQPGTGWIEVKCEPGVKVFLDDAFKGSTTTDLGGLILEGIPAGQHQIKVVKDGFSPQDASVPVKAGDGYVFTVRPFTPQLKIEQTGAAGSKDVIQKTGVLLLQTLPTNCTVSVPGALPQTPKTNDKLRISDFPAGSYTATISGLGKTMKVDFEVRHGEETHLFVHLLNGTVENRSKWAVAGPDARPAPPPPAAPAPVAAPAPLSPGESLQRARVDLQALEQEITRLDEALKTGTGGLDAVAAMVARRNDLEKQQQAARAAVTQAERLVAGERKMSFEADNQKYQSIAANASVPDTVKQAAWRELCTKWNLHFGSIPRPLLWRDSGPDLVRGHLRVNLDKSWPMDQGLPAVFIGSAKAADVTVQDGGYQLELRWIPIGSNLVRLEHPKAAAFASNVLIDQDAFTDIMVTLKPRPAFIQWQIEPSNATVLLQGGGARGFEKVELDGSGRVEVVPALEHKFIVRAKGYEPTAVSLTVPHGETVTRLVTLRPQEAPATVGARPAARVIALGRDAGLQIELVGIPAGSIGIGSDVPEADDFAVSRSPRTQVTISQAFWMGKTEVTQRQFEAIGLKLHVPHWLKQNRFRGGDLPVVGVPWKLAMEFCQRLTEQERAAGRLPAGYVYSLPSEAQWEFAARAGEAGDFPSDVQAQTWYEENSNERPHSVGSKAPNKWGLQDMLGNVSEWCRDFHGPYPGGSVTDYRGPAIGGGHVIRGGNWRTPLRFIGYSWRQWGSDSVQVRVESTLRSWAETGHRDGTIGFRIALVPQE